MLIKEYAMRLPSTSLHNMCTASLCLFAIFEHSSFCCLLKVPCALLDFKKNFQSKMPRLSKCEAGYHCKR